MIPPILGKIDRRKQGFNSSMGKTFYIYILFNIKILLKLPIRTNNNKLRTALGIPDIKIYLFKRLQKLKIKY